MTELPLTLKLWGKGINFGVYSAIRGKVRELQNFKNTAKRREDFKSMEGRLGDFQDKL